MRKQLTYTITDQENGFSVEAILKMKLGLSKKEISRLKFIDDGILCAGKRVYTNHLVQSGDVVVVQFKEETQRKTKKSSKLSIVYEDEDVIVVDKPKGIVCHAVHHHQDDHLGYLLQQEKSLGKIRVIGRLDKDVSGLVLYAKNQPAAARLSKQRQVGDLKKVYMALVEGCMEKKTTLHYDLYPQMGIKKKANLDGDSCITHIERIQKLKDACLIRIEIETGKSHQIRSGLAAYGHPIIGDVLYGTSQQEIACALHANQLSFIQPFTKEKITLESSLPTDMQMYIKKGR